MTNSCNRKMVGLLLILALTLGLSVSLFAEEGKIPITTSSDEALKLYLQARDLAEKLRYQESIAYYEQAVSADPQFAMALLGLAYVEPSAKAFFARLDQAVALVDKVSEGEKVWILGFQAGAHGKAMKQQEHFRKLVEMYPNDERAHNLLANHYFGQQEWQKAIDEYQAAIAINPEFSQPYNQLGYAKRFLGQYDQAEMAFQKYIELIPDDPNPYDSYAELLLKMGEYQKSIDHYRKALEINDNFVPSYVGIATNLNFLGKHEEARAQLQQLYESARDDGQRRAVHFATAVSYADQGDYEQALAEIASQYGLASKIADAVAMANDHVIMGDILLEAGKPEQAQANYDEALKVMQASDLDADVKANAEAAYIYHSAEIALAQDDVEGAKKKARDFQKRVEANENRLQIMQAHELLGMIAMAEEDYVQAIAEFGQANLQDPYNLYRAALVYDAMGSKEDAKKFCNKVVGFNALNNLHYSFVRDDARQMLENL